MISIKAFRALMGLFPEIKEQPHFEKTSFRLGKKIFATLDSKNYLACINLSEVKQDIFSSVDKTVIFPVPNKWGKQGWTFIDLRKVHRNVLKDALITAYIEMAPAKLVTQFNLNNAKLQ